MCMNLSSKVRVAVLRGGQSHGYDASLQTGQHILSVLREKPEVYDPLDIFISKDGEWHHSGLVDEPHNILRQADVVWNALHGQYGEDGQVQKVLESVQIPFTGSGTMASALSMNKDMSKRLYKQHSLPTPLYELVTENDFNEDQLIRIFRNFLYPVVIKPANRLNNLGVRLAHTFHELKKIIKETFSHSPRVLVEEFIKGDDASCLVIEGHDGEMIYTLYPLEKSISKFKKKQIKEIGDIAKQAHKILGLRHYSDSDFRITPKGKIYILETNSLPLLHENSLAHQSLLALGWKVPEFVDHVLKLTVSPST
jgi:D-alanine-D-alanine ligase